MYPLQHAPVAPAPVRLADYQPPAWLVDRIALEFDIRAPHVAVRADMTLRRNPASDAPRGPIVLDGVKESFVSVAVDGTTLSAREYDLDQHSLTFEASADQCTVSVLTALEPERNTALMGLYRSGEVYCTQCEAEGFRRITFFPDRPDVLARYTTTLVADRNRFPVLLSNGNKVSSEQLDDGRHRVVWDDPWPKPSYLFALVAGDLACLRDSFTTHSGRNVAIEFHVDHHNADRCGHAIASLKKAMRWDEQRYGREYDLDVYMVVAVDAFTMGAMENKGLNIFNSRYVLARPDTATDVDYEGIESVIAHEYFHNWSGNRVTCRDWFQLSLKEGFTVFRDQQFSEETGSAGVKRIHDVNVLRTHQFREDAGPMAHPVRPESYVEINNFYTTTIYNKGAEVIRMLRVLLGDEGFRAGTDLYFERHDGQAVTTDDFVRAMEDANEVSLQRFRRWYTQAGTPRLDVSMDHDANTQTCRIRVVQSCPPTSGQRDKAPFHIPLAIGLLGPDGTELALRGDGENHAQQGTRVLELTEKEHEFVFRDIAAPPVVSWLRGFCAPVRLVTAIDDDALAFLIAHDTDPFARWEAAQSLGVRAMEECLESGLSEGSGERVSRLVDALQRTLSGEISDLAFVAQLLTLPSEAYLAEQFQPMDPLALHDAHRAIRRHIAERLEDALVAQIRATPPGADFDPGGAAAGRRALDNLCLGYLAELGGPAIESLCAQRFAEASNMTTSLGALAALVRIGGFGGEQALAAFYRRWENDTLVIDKWFAIQAANGRDATLEGMQALVEHAAFDERNPNRVRALLGTFAHGNPAGLHGGGATAYRFIGDWVLRLDRLNPQVAARLAGALSHWRRFAPRYREPMREQVQRIADAGELSRDTAEIVARSLAD